MSSLVRAGAHRRRWPHASVGVCVLWLAFSGAPRAADVRLVDAAKRNDARAVQALIKQGVDVNTPQADGATALHWAAHWDDFATADLLIRSGANVNVEEETGTTPLVLASLNGSAPMVDRLLEAGARPDVGREKAVMVAARTGNPEVMKLLLAHGGDANAREPERGPRSLLRLR